MKRLIISEKAMADLEDIWLYSAGTWSTKQADIYVGLLKSACRNLAARRRIGQSIHDIKPDHLRIHVGSHTLYYRLNVEGVLTIERILHQSMDVIARL